MIIAMAQHKGGVGQSIIGFNLAIELQRRERTVIVVDADRTMRSSTTFGDDRAANQLPVIPVVAGNGNLVEMLQSLDAQYDYVIVDSKGGDTTETRTSIVAADVVVSPLSGQQNDLDSLEEFAKTVTAARDMNPDLRVLVVLNRVSPQGRTGEVSSAKEYIADYPEFELAETVITTTSAWGKARSEGKGVVEFDAPKQKAALQVLASEILGE